MNSAWYAMCVWSEEAQGQDLGLNYRRRRQKILHRLLAQHLMAV